MQSAICEYEEAGALFRFEGTITCRNVVRMHSDLYDHPMYQEVKYFVIDATLVNDMEDHVPELASSLDRSFATYNPKVTVLFVSPNPKIVAYFKQYQKLLKGTDWSFETFSSLSAAQTFLCQQGLKTSL